MTETCTANLDQTFVGVGVLRCGKSAGHDGSHEHHSDRMDAEWTSEPSPSGKRVNNTVISAVNKPTR